MYNGQQQAGAAADAGKAQQEAASAATGLQRNMFNTIQQNNRPYMNAGSASIGELMNRLGLLDSAPQYKRLPDGRTVEQAAKDAWDADQPRLTAAGNADRGTYESIDPTGYKQIMDRYQNTVMQDNGLNQAGSGADANSGSLLHAFDANDLKTNLAPNYDFMLKQGQGATQNMANLSGGVISGNALKGINDYTQNYASNAYQQAYNNFNNNQTNIFNRLSGIAGLGQNAANNTGNSGVQLASGMANSTMAGGQAQASGIVGASNAMAGGLNNASSYYNLGKIMNGSGSGAGSYTTNMMGGADGVGGLG